MQIRNKTHSLQHNRKREEEAGGNNVREDGRIMAEGSLCDAKRVLILRYTQIWFKSVSLLTRFTNKKICPNERAFCSFRGLFCCVMPHGTGAGFSSFLCPRFLLSERSLGGEQKNPSYTWTLDEHAQGRKRRERSCCSSEKKMGKKCFYTAVCPLLQLEKEGKG